MKYFTCTGCGESKTTDLFFKDKKNPHGHETRCKACRCARMKEIKQEPSRKAARRKWSQDYYEQNKDKINSYNKEWALNNNAKFRVYWANRRAALKKATPKWATSELEKLLIDEIYDLAKRREVALGVKMHVDHIVPLQSDLVCGLHCSANLQILTAEENFKKNNRYWPDMPDEEFYK